MPVSNPWRGYHAKGQQVDGSEKCGDSFHHRILRHHVVAVRGRDVTTLH